MKQLDLIKVKGFSEKLPGGLEGRKILGLRIGISIKKILNYIKSKKYRKV